VSGRIATWLAAAGCALALAGCGGGSEETSSEPVIPARVADDLAARSEEIAATLDEGDRCSAAQQADDLNNAVNEAVAKGQIPTALQGELQNVVTELVNTVNCEEPKEEEEDEDKGKGKGKGKGNKDEDDDGGVIVTTTIELGTTTE
jgi:hypothetical protein